MKWRLEWIQISQYLLKQRIYSYNLFKLFPNATFLMEYEKGGIPLSFVAHSRKVHFIQSLTYSFAIKYFLGWSTAGQSRKSTECQITRTGIKVFGQLDGGSLLLIWLKESMRSVRSVRIHGPNILAQDKRFSHARCSLSRFYIYSKSNRSWCLQKRFRSERAIGCFSELQKKV